MTEIIVQGFRRGDKPAVGRLAKEYRELKKRLFDAQGQWITTEPVADFERYWQLHGLFYPQFRAGDWKCPGGVTL